jgi:hypothetical protein
MEASSARNHEYGGKRRWVKYWSCLGCWISPCYGLFSLGGSSETLIFQFFLGRGKPRITETVHPESADTGARLYMSEALLSAPAYSHMETYMHSPVTYH